MKHFQQINVEQAKELIDKQPVAIVDIRDDDSYKRGHIENASHLTNDNVQEFIQQADFDTPVIVYCYHGNSSQPAAQYLIEQGFDEVYSLIGGYGAWGS
jgi:thiosulfate sulfurtransferase